MDEAHDALVLSIAEKRGFISHAVAATVRPQLASHGPDYQPIGKVLVAGGHITAAQAELLHQEAARQHAPKVIGGHQLVAKLGQGGMGAVYKAIQLSLQREVALKVLPNHLSTNPEFVDRFMREARAAGKVLHPNVIACHDVGKDHGIVYMSLELVRGGDALQAAKRSGGQLPEAQALAICRDCALGLDAIAKAGLIHRDIKPANIFITESGTAKLADLGLARSADGDDRMTQTGATVGSPAYMSPEQARGNDDLDIRSDIYSLGAALYHLLSGHAPYSAGATLATLQQVVNDPLPDMNAITPPVSEATAEILLRAMAKDRDQRYANARDLAADLDRALRGKMPSHGRPAPIFKEDVNPRAAEHHGYHPQFTKTPSAGRAPLARPSRLPLILGVSLGLLTVAAVAAVLVLRHGGSAKPASTQPVASGPGRPLDVPKPVPLPPAVADGKGAKPSGDTAAEAHPLRQHRLERLGREQLTSDVLQQQIEAAATAVSEQSAPSRASPAPAVATPFSPIAVKAPEKTPDKAPIAVAAQLPPWADAGIRAVDLLVEGKLTEAVAAAEKCPSEIRAAIAAVPEARAQLPQIVKAHGASVLAAKPALPTAAKFPGLALSSFADDAVVLRSPDGKAALEVKWAKLDTADWTALRKALPAADLSDGEAASVAAAQLTSIEAIRAAPVGDPVAAVLRKLLALKAEKEAAVKAAKAAERRQQEATRAAEDALARFGVDAQRADDDTRRLLLHIAELTLAKPTVISGAVTQPTELRDLVVIRPGTSLTENALLIPTAGALVINFAERIIYRPVEVSGLPFVSLSASRLHTHTPTGYERDLVFGNCIFYGPALLDGIGSARFRRCAFIGGSDYQFQRVDAVNPVQRHEQFVACDFARLHFESALPIAASSGCSFRECTLTQPQRLPLRDATSIAAWDVGGGLQRSVKAQLMPGSAALSVEPQSGLPTTPFAANSELIGHLLDGVIKQQLALNSGN